MSAPSPANPLVLARRLDDLNERLLSVPLRDGARAAVPAEFVRIELALALLGAEGAEGERAAWSRLRESFAAIRQTLTDVPERNLLALAVPWRRLAEFLESLLARLDAGDPTGDCLADPRWAEVGLRLAWADGPLAVAGQIQEVLDKWGERWHGADLTPGQRRELARQWQALRSQGDAAFLAGLLDDLPGFPPPGRSR